MTRRKAVIVNAVRTGVISLEARRQAGVRRDRRLLLENRFDFYLVQPGAASLQRVVRFTDQYNRLIERLAEQVEAQVHSFDPPSYQRALSGNLEAIRMALDDAIREIGPMHDEATSAA